MTVPILKESYHMNHNLVRRDSMFSAFRLGPAASGRELCDIESLKVLPIAEGGPPFE